MNLTSESLDKLSLHIKNMDLWKRQADFNFSMTINSSVNNQYSKVHLSNVGNYIKPAEIMSSEERLELIEFAKAHIEKCLNNRLKEAKKQFKQELLGED